MTDNPTSMTPEERTAHLNSIQQRIADRLEVSDEELASAVRMMILDRASRATRKRAPKTPAAPTKPVVSLKDF